MSRRCHTWRLPHRKHPAAWVCRRDQTHHQTVIAHDVTTIGNLVAWGKSNRRDVPITGKNMMEHFQVHAMQYNRLPREFQGAVSKTPPPTPHSNHWDHLSTGFSARAHTFSAPTQQSKVKWYALASMSRRDIRQANVMCARIF